MPFINLRESAKIWKDLTQCLHKKHLDPTNFPCKAKKKKKTILSSETWINLYEFVAQTIVMMYHVCHLKIGLNFSGSAMVEVIRREIGHAVRVDKCKI